MANDTCPLCGTTLPDGTPTYAIVSGFQNQVTDVQYRVHANCLSSLFDTHRLIRGQLDQTLQDSEERRRLWGELADCDERIARLFPPSAEPMT